MAQRPDPKDPDPANWPAAKRKVYEAALELFWTRGYETTSVQEIVQAAGLSKGALYHYFTSKDEIAKVMNERYLDALIPEVREMLSREVVTEDIVREIMAVMLGSVQKYHREVSLLHTIRFLDDNTFAATKAKRDELEHLVDTLIERAIQAGIVRKVGNPRLITFALFGMASYAQYWWRPDGPLSEAETAQLFADMFGHGVLVNP